MSLRDRYDFEYLVNETERIVLDELERQLAKSDYDQICKCQDCILDMAALALNSVSPRYRVSLLGSLYAQAIDETAYGKKVHDAVDEAIIKVSENPSHD
ncbi:MAG: late competence development ComFB family protein [Spirochaetia bacterium]